MGAHQVVVYEGAQVVVRKLEDLGHFVGRAEAVKEMEERYAGFQGSGLRNGGKIVCFLHRAGGQQRKTGLAELPLHPGDRRRWKGPVPRSSVQPHGTPCW